jgi:hypothetical protein
MFWNDDFSLVLLKNSEAAGMSQTCQKLEILSVVQNSFSGGMPLKIR